MWNHETQDIEFEMEYYTIYRTFRGPIFVQYFMTNFIDGYNR